MSLKNLALRITLPTNSNKCITVLTYFIIYNSFCSYNQYSNVSKFIEVKASISSLYIPIPIDASIAAPTAPADTPFITNIFFWRPSEMTLTPSLELVIPHTNTKRFPESPNSSHSDKFCFSIRAADS